MLATAFALGATSFMASFLATEIIRRLANRHGWIVAPRPDRWHQRPTAMHGGLGFGVVFILAAAGILMRHVARLRLVGIEALPKEVILGGALIAGAVVILVFGLFDDLKGFRPATKVLCEVVVASGFVFSGGILTVSGVQVVDLLLTYFWFIGITNAVYMLDNMDGLAAGVVIVASIALVVLSIPSPGTENASILAVSLGVAFIGALTGFLLHNLPPASIFMGDSGSLTIGYVLAGLAVPSPLNGFMSIGGHSSVYGPLLVILIPATVLAIPIFDTTLVTITRKWSAKRMSEGGRDHSSHRLVGLGLSEWRTLTILYGMAALGGSIAVLMQRLPGQSVPLFGAFVVVLVLSGVYLGQVKVQFLESTHIPPAWTPLVSNILYKRHAAEVLADTVLIVLCFYAAYLLRFEG